MPVWPWMWNRRYGDAGDACGGCGIYGVRLRTDEREYYEGQTYLVAVYMTEAAFKALLEENGVTAASSSFYVHV